MTLAPMYAPVANHPALRFAMLCHRGPDCAPVRIAAPRLSLPVRHEADRKLSGTPWG